MKLRNKNTGDPVKFVSIETIYKDKLKLTYILSSGLVNERYYTSIEKFNEDWEDYKPKEPLIKDEKIRKAVRAWAEANNFSVFRVNNQHFNYVKIHGVKDRYDPNGSNIEFMGTIAGVEKRTYEIDELCGEEKE